MSTDTKTLLASLGAVVTRDIKARIRNNLVMPASHKEGGHTLLRSTRLMRSITYQVAADGQSVIVGTNVRYARIQHEGGTIKPVHTKYLAIPLTKAAAVRKPRDWQDTWIAKNCIMHNGANGEPEALYLLKKQVTIPARPYMFIDEPTLSSLRKLVVTYFDTKLKGALHA